MTSGIEIANNEGLREIMDQITSMPFGGQRSELKSREQGEDVGLAFAVNDGKREVASYQFIFRGSCSAAKKMAGKDNLALSNKRTI